MWATLMSTLLGLVSMVRCEAFMVRLPHRHIAMLADLEVEYSLAQSQALVTAVVHVEYVVAVSMGHLPVASLPVPMGVARGTLVVDCPLVPRAGRLRAVLTVDGETVAVSDLLSVDWPPISMAVPASLEMFAADVSVNVAFKRSLCNHKVGLMETNRPRMWMDTVDLVNSDDLEVRLELVRCSEDVHDQREDLCTRKSQLVTSHSVKAFYAHNTFSVLFNCSVWDAVGVFRINLVANIDDQEMAMVASSPSIRVQPNREFAVGNVDWSHVAPCLHEDVRPLSLRRPNCATRRRSDALRVYGQVTEDLGQGNLIPSHWDFLGERRLSDTDDLVFVPCSTLLGNEEDEEQEKGERQDYWRFCFKYVGINGLGETRVRHQLCLPAQPPELALAEATWGEWQPWSGCSRVCVDEKEKYSGVRSRFRMCHLPADQPQRILCDGERVEQEACSRLPLCSSAAAAAAAAASGVAGAAGGGGRERVRLARTFADAHEAREDPCACGCIFIVDEQRLVGIRSASECDAVTLPSTSTKVATSSRPRWRIKTNVSAHTLFVEVLLVQHSCLDGLLHVHDIDPLGKPRRLLASIGFFDAFHITLNSSGPEIAIQLHSKRPNVSCQVNMELLVVVIDPSMAAAAASNVATRLWTHLLTTINHLPLAVLLLTALLLIVVACSLLLLCHFESATPCCCCVFSSGQQKAASASNDLLDQMPLVHTEHRGGRRRAADAHSLPQSPVRAPQTAATAAATTAAAAAAAAARQELEKALPDGNASRMSRSLTDLLAIVCPAPQPPTEPMTRGTRWANIGTLRSSLSSNRRKFSKQQREACHQERPMNNSSGPNVQNSSRDEGVLVLHQRRGLNERHFNVYTTNMEGMESSEDKPSNHVSVVSVASGEPELELDLYDYHISNLATMPGSNFGVKPREGVLFDTMRSSRTSDLTASVTSSDVNNTLTSDQTTWTTILAEPCDLNCRVNHQSTGKDQRPRS